MRVKRFVAGTLPDAMVKVKMDMGKDAVILHTRKFKEGGFFGFFGNNMFEVTAAIEDFVPGPTSRLKVVEPIIPGRDNPVAAASEGEERPDVHGEIVEMKLLINEIRDQLETSQDLKSFPKCFHKYHQILMDNEVEDKLSQKILKEMLKLIPRDSTLNQQLIGDLLEKQILRLLKKPKPITFKKQGLHQQSVALVGPTGVGKTTTIAKLAATFSIVDKKNVALITADTYRVAAVEQLKTYGEIIGIPVDVVFSPDELQEAINRHSDKELILIDTAGRSHKNEEQMVELKNLLDIAAPSEIFLVLSAATKCKDMLEIVDTYSDIAFNRLIFTKLDETSSYGTLLNVISKTQKSLSYVTVGQNVPDDIEVADPAKIVKMIMRER